MPASQPAAASERRNDRMTTHEPPKLKTTLKTPPKQATNPLQFVKVGPCSLYRTAQEQLQKVEEVKKIKQEVREDPEDWQSNLDNWKSSRRKRQEHIIERVVEVKKLELEEHDRQRRRSKTFSEMMEERGTRGRKMSISLAVYHEEDANDLSDLGIGTSSGKSSVSGDTHDDTHSVLSDRDSEIEKNHSDVDNIVSENGNNLNNKPGFENGFHNNHSHQEYDSATTATASSPEPEEYTYEGAIRGYVSRVSQNIPRRSLVSLDNKLDNGNSNANGSKSDLSEDKGPVVKVDILKRREIFEKAAQKNTDNKANRSSGDFTNAKSIKERLSNLEKQKHESENVEKSNKTLNRLSGDMSSIRERLSHLEKQTTEREIKNAHKINNGELETVRPLRERLSTLEKYCSNDDPSAPVTRESRYNGELSAKTIKDRLSALDAARNKELEKRSAAKHTLCYRDTETRIETSTPSERSSSPDSEYRVPRAAFHRSLDSLDADASSGPDTFERVQSLEELDYSRRYPASSSSAELLNDTDREDSGIHTADVSCSVSQADEPVDEEIVAVNTVVVGKPENIEKKPEAQLTETAVPDKVEKSESVIPAPESVTTVANQPESAVTQKETAETSGELSTNKYYPEKNVDLTNTGALHSSSSDRPVIYRSPKVPPRKSPPELLRSTPAVTVEKVTSEPVHNVESKAVSMTAKKSISPDQSTSVIVNELLSENSSNTQEIETTVVTHSEALEASLKDVSPITPPQSPTAAPKTLSVESPVSSTLNTSQVPKTSAPVSPQLPTCRSASKIPTPLPRKIIPNKPPQTNSSPPLTFSTSATTILSKTPLFKIRSSPQKPQITPPSSPQSPKATQMMVLPLTSELSAPTISGINSSPSSEAVSPLLSSPPSSLFIPSPVATELTTSVLPQIASCSLAQAPSSPPHDTSPLSLIPSPTPPTAPQVMVVNVLEKRPADRRRTVVEVCEKVMVPHGEAPPTPPVTPFITLARVGDNESSEKPIIVGEKIVKQPIEETTPVEGPQMANPPMITEIDTVLQKRNEDSLKMLEEPLPILAPSPPERPSTLNFGKAAPIYNTMEILSPLSPMSKQILTLNLSSDEEIVAGLAFPMGPPTSGEPPKEKPPPPPIDLSDEENLPTEPLKRLNSTRRIKKELRTRRSDFLGIEGVNDDDLERELTLTKPPDMAAILAEERRIEQLHRRSYDTDSNYEQDSSHERDSGVELGLGHPEDWTKHAVSPDMSQHSRQSSEPFGASVTSSEEDEITKKEREIIEVLEKEEQWRYGNNGERNSDIGEKLAHKLRELEEEKMQLERERAQEVELRRQEETLRKNEENIRKQEEILRKQQEEVARQQEAARTEAERQAEARRQAEEKRQEELRIKAEQLRIQGEIEEKERRAADMRHQEEMRLRAMESQIREQENNALVGAGLSSREDEYASGEVLRVERELLQLEQEELKRQRNNLAYREQKQQQLAEQLQEQWKSLQDVAKVSVNNTQQFKQQPPVNYRSSMPNLQLQEGQRRRPPPPPIPPAKPLRLVEQRQRDVTIRSSRMPSADSIPQQVELPLRHSASATTLATHAGQQMTRQTLQALSAVPRPRIVQGDQWVQRRKSDVPRGAQDFNYQHWLIQEAEQRRINEQNQRSPRKLQPHVTGTSVPYIASPPRPDNKPLPDSIIQTLTQRVQNRAQEKPIPPRRRLEQSASQEHLPIQQQPQQHQIQQQKLQQQSSTNNADAQEKMLSVSGKKKCSHCGDELGRGAAMIIESLRLFYHMECFKCCVCHVRLGDGLMGTDVRVRNHKLHCHNCYSSDDGVKFSCV